MSISSVPSGFSNGTNPAASQPNGGTQTSEVKSTSKRGEIQAQVSIAELLHKEKYELSLSDEAVIKAIEKANKAINGVNKKFAYSVHKPTGEILVKVLNSETDEVIREIPPEKIVDLVAKLQEICGVIIDEKR